MDKRHFTVVIGSKEHGLYISSKPSSAAKKAVSKLCASNKSKKVEFSLREITQGSKKKTYGPYLGEMKKLKKPIELKGRVIRHEIKLHLKNGKRSTTKTAKKMRGGEENENIYVIKKRIDEFHKQFHNLIEMKKFQEILNAIFDGNIELYDILTLSEEHPTFFQDMINYINSLHSNENKNEYFFIICYVIAFRDRYYNILDYFISKIGLDKLIEIVYEIDYGTVFDRIISNILSQQIDRMNQREISFMKGNLFMKLIKYNSKKMLLENFKELLIKLFSIQNNSFITHILYELYEFFINSHHGYQLIQPSFKLFDFLLENKEQFKNFIRIFISIFNIERSNHVSISPKISEILGITQTQDELFKMWNQIE